jgi:hypothetical protein
MQQWNLNVQKELPSHIVLSVAYVGSKGTHLTFLSDGNQIVPVSAADNPYIAAGNIPISSGDCTTLTAGPGGPAVTGQALVNLNVACGNVNPDQQRTAFPGYGDITQLRNNANSIYHALQVQAHRTVGDLTLSVAYTYSHAIDDSSDRSDFNLVNSYDIAANRASSNYDLRHNFSISYVYGLPFFKHEGLAHALLGGWQISGITTAQTGLPFTVTNGTAFTDNAGVANNVVSNNVGSGSRPDLVGDPRSGFSSNQDPSAQAPLFYNPAAFTIPVGLTFGNVGRNTLNEPSRLNFDVGIFKRFQITEKTGIDFRWENFNFFNHTQFNGIDNTLGSSTFLEANTAHFSRKMQFGLRLYF